MADFAVLKTEAGHQLLQESRHLLLIQDQLQILANDAEGYSADGTVVTPANSGGPSGRALGAVAGDVTASTTQKHNGSYSYKLTPAVGVMTTVRLDSDTTSPRAATSLWIYLTGQPLAASTEWIRFETAAGVNVMRVNLLVTSGFLRVVDQAAATIATGATAIPLNQWCKWLVTCEQGNNNLGTISVTVYDTNGTTVITSLSGVGDCGADPIGRAIYGKRTTATDLAPCYFDEIRLRLDSISPV